MPHIDLPDLPGILAPMAKYPEAAAVLNSLARVLLTKDDGLSRGERELIAAHVSKMNQCVF